MSNELIFSGVSVFASVVALVFVILRKPTVTTVTQPCSECIMLKAQLDKAELNAKLADRKAGADILASYADQAVAAAEQLGGSGPDKLQRALDALRVLDAGDNGKRDWTDAQHRIAIEAAILRSK
jgi:hypothetical protein